MTEPEVKPQKPNCYECVHRGALPGSAHLCCLHPDSGLDPDTPVHQLAQLLGKRLGVVKRSGEASRWLGVRGAEYGIKNGWFNWPFNFDPTWLKTCEGFEKVEER